jgi:hypothetical protein
VLAGALPQGIRASVTNACIHEVGGDPHDNVANGGMSGEESGDVAMESNGRQSPEPGEPAPDFRLPSTRGPDVALSDFRGHKHVLLAFLRGMT